VGIVSGYISMGATLHDVCRKAGLSTATVSRVINNSPLVTKRTRARVLKAIQALGYHPSRAARTLSRKRSDMIAVIFPEIASGFYTEVLRGIDEVAGEHNFHLTTAFAHGQRDEHTLALQALNEQWVAGLLILNLFEVSLPAEAVKLAAEQRVPVVSIDRPVRSSHVISVSMDNVAGAAAAVDHLFAHGYRDIAVIRGPRGNYDADQRWLGCQQAAERAGIALPEDRIWSGTFIEGSGRLAMERWLDTGRPLPRAIFACNDAMAIGALEVLSERGLKVPEDVALVGFDDVDSARHLGLTTVRVPMRAMGRAAAEAAIKQIVSGGTQQQHVLTTQLIVRRSCGCDPKKSKSVAVGDQMKG
jgi:LacI family transcriptional regulator